MYSQSVKDDASTQEGDNSKNVDSSSSSQGALNAMIAELEEKLKKLLEKINRLKAKGDEESLRQAAALEAEAATINSQITELIKQKMEVSQSPV